jgi:IS4 transposase
MTNNESFKPETIQLLYKQRWKIELFFKWLKQNLKIKTFLGTSKNAVFTQIWIAMIAYLLLWYIKNQTHYRFSFLKLSRIINEAIFERVHFIDLLQLQSFAQLYSDPSQLSFGFS